MGESVCLCGKMGGRRSSLQSVVIYGALKWPNKRLCVLWVCEVSGYNYFAEYTITYSHTLLSTLRKYWSDAPRVNWRPSAVSICAELSVFQKMLPSQTAIAPRSWTHRRKKTPVLANPVALNQVDKWYAISSPSPDQLQLNYTCIHISSRSRALQTTKMLCHQSPFGTGTRIGWRFFIQTHTRIEQMFCPHIAGELIKCVFERECE